MRWVFITVASVDRVTRTAKDRSDVGWVLEEERVPSINLPNQSIESINQASWYQAIQSQYCLQSIKHSIHRLGEREGEISISNEYHRESTRVHVHVRDRELVGGIDGAARHRIDHEEVGLLAREALNQCLGRDTLGGCRIIWRHPHIRESCTCAYISIDSAICDTYCLQCGASLRTSRKSPSLVTILHARQYIDRVHVRSERASERVRYRATF